MEANSEQAFVINYTSSQIARVRGMRWLDCCVNSLCNKVAADDLGDSQGADWLHTKKLQFIMQSLSQMNLENQHPQAHLCAILNTRPREEQLGLLIGGLAAEIRGAQQQLACLKCSHFFATQLNATN